VVADRTDAIVVGAGPAGSATALLLARQGLRVLIVEKSAAPPPKVCGEYLSPGCRPLLDRLGALAPLHAAGARPLRGMRIHSLAGRVLEARYSPAPGSIHGLSVPRQVLDPLLLDLAGKAGADLESEFLVSDLLREGDRVTGVRGRARGRWAERRARIVIGADGRFSVVAARLGGRRPHPGLDRMAWVAYCEGMPRDDTLGEIFLGPNCYGILNPIAPGLTNLGFVLPRGPVPRDADRATALRHAAARIPTLQARIERAEIVGAVRCLGPLAFRALRLTAPGALLVGDAAGFLDPFTGEGIFAGLRSAELAAHAVPAALSNPEADAAAYARAWHAEFESKWRLMLALQHAIRRPWLAEALVAYLVRHAGPLATLMAAAGDLLAPEALRPARLIAQALRRSSDARTAPR
jgi:menaquinone-9 beta-reductase